jgi:putative ABC transport system permease protein
MREDLVQAVRRLARRPGFTVVAVATLTLGIAGATAIFSVTHAVVLRELPYAEPERLVLAWQRDEARHVAFLEMSYPTYRHWREASRVFDDLAGLPSTNQTWTLSESGDPATLVGRLVTASFFPVLGVEPALGRTLRPEDDRRGAARVVVLGYALWRDRFGGDPGIVGRAITLDREPFTVVGVMPAGFAYPKGAQLWTPLVPGVGELAEQPGVWWMSAIGRLRPGVALATAEREMSELTGRYHLETYRDEGIAAVLTPFHEAVLGPTRPVLLALLGGVALVLLLACANVAALQAVRVAERAPELAVRSALGASRARLARALVAESVVLSVTGGATGRSRPRRSCRGSWRSRRRTCRAWPRRGSTERRWWPRSRSRPSPRSPPDCCRCSRSNAGLSATRSRPCRARSPPGGAACAAPWWRRRWRSRSPCSWARGCWYGASPRCGTCRSATTPGT